LSSRSRRLASLSRTAKRCSHLIRTTCPQEDDMRSRSHLGVVMTGLHPCTVSGLQASRPRHQASESGIGAASADPVPKQEILPPCRILVLLRNFAHFGSFPLPPYLGGFRRLLPAILRAWPVVPRLRISCCHLATLTLDELLRPWPLRGTGRRHCRFPQKRLPVAR
jgi:hypothetical protein